MILRDLDEITKMTKRILGRTFDYESTAAAIWLEAWNNMGCPATTYVNATWNFVRQRCIDVSRRSKTEVIANKIKVQDLRVREHDALALKPELLNLIMSAAKLSNIQFMIVARKFWNEQTFVEISEALKLPRAIVSIEWARALDELKRVSRLLDYERP